MSTVFPAHRRARLVVPVVLALLAGCFGSEPEPAVDPHAGEDLTPSNRVDIPAPVRSNLGITFVTVERRDVERTLRVPGRFEFLPTARREYRTVLPGRVELLVEQYQHVAAGTTIYRIDSPAWRELQQRLTDLDASRRSLGTRLETFAPLLAAHTRHEESLEESISLWSERSEQLQQVRAAGGGRVEELASARSALASARAELAAVTEKEAELAASKAQTEADLDAALARRTFLLTSFASLLDRPVAELEEIVEVDGVRRPRWATIDRVEVRADEPGVVEALGITNGSWADETSPVVTMVRPDLLRFRAQGLQSDLGLLRDGLPARIVPPVPTRSGAAIDLQETMSGTLALGISGDPDDRTVDLYVTPATLSSWARPGISAQLEIVTRRTDDAKLAVPLAAVQRDGLTPVIFRRDPRNPSVAIRLEADLGLDDGRWVVVKSGVGLGDEIVLDGAFQLLLATSGSIQQGGHFHADGTFHEEDH